MKIRIADDYAAIAARMRELRLEPTIPEPEPELYCAACENGGWIMMSMPGGLGPHFDVCKECGNPNDYPPP